MSWQQLRIQGPQEGPGTVADALIAAHQRRLLEEKMRADMLMGTRQQDNLEAHQQALMAQAQAELAQQKNFQGAQVQNWQDLREQQKQEEQRRQQGLMGAAQGNAIKMMGAGDDAGAAATMTAGGWQRAPQAPMNLPAPKDSDANIDSIRGLFEGQEGAAPTQMQMPDQYRDPASNRTVDLDGDVIRRQVSEAKQAEAVRRGEQMDNMIGPASGLDSVSRGYLPTLRGAVVGGGVKPEEALSEMEKKRHNVAMENRPVPGGGIGGQRLDLQKEGAARALAKDVMSGLGYKEEAGKNRRFNNMAGRLAQNNAALDATTAGEFVKQAQGGTGVVSEGDMETFWNKIGGASSKTWQWVHNVMDGKIEPEKRANVLGAVQWLAMKAKENLGIVRNQMSYAFKTSPNLADYHDQMVGTYFPDEGNKIMHARKVTAAAEKMRAGRLKGGGKDELDTDLENL